MKRFIYFFLLIASQLPLFSQEECGTESSADPNFSQKQFEDFLQKRATNPLSKMMPTNVPIQAHIIRRSDGSGGLTLTELNNALATANNRYAATNLTFSLCGPVNYIDNTSYYDFDQSSEETPLTNAHYVNDVVNIYFANTVNTAGGSRCGFAYYPWATKDYIFMNNFCTTNGATLSHELGHYFGLYHTHETAFGRELASGTNCTTAGDRLCDTPADPELGSTSVSSNCLYTGTSTDPQGAQYAPDIRNLMSYSRSACRNRFSSDQVNRIIFYSQNGRDNLNCPSSAPLPNITLDQNGTNSYTVNGNQVDITATAINDGQIAATSNTQIGFYLSDDNSFNTSDELIATATLGNLAAGASSTQTISVDVCNLGNPIANGDYYIGFILDQNNDLTESDETDNIWYFNNGPHLTVNCTQTGSPNLNLDQNGTNTYSVNGSQINATASLLNDGQGTANGPFSIGFYLSTNSTISSSDFFIGESTVNTLAPGTSTSVSISVDACNLGINIPDDDYYIGFILDKDEVVAESDESDNDWRYINGPHLSLVCTNTGTVNLTLDQAGTNSYTVNGSQLDATATVKNEGQGSSSTFKVGFYLSINNTFSTSDYLIAESTLNNLGAGVSSPVSISLDICNLGISVPDDDYYIGFIIDKDEEVTESDETDNIWRYNNGPHLNLVCTNSGTPNLTLDQSGTNTYSVTGNQVEVNLSIINDGTSASTSTSNIGYYLSTDNSLSTSDYLIASSTIGTLAAGASTTSSISVDVCTIGLSIPNDDYHILFLLDKDDEVAESDETDNDWYFTNGPHANINCSGPTQYQVSLIANPANGGALSGAGFYNVNQVVTAIATPNSGYVFKNWTFENNVLSSDETYGFVLNSDMTLVANFETTTSILEEGDQVIAKIYPNPTGGKFHLEISNPSQKISPIKVYNHVGAQVHAFDPKPGQAFITFDWESFPEGMYYIRLAIDEKEYVLPLVKQ